MQGAGTTTGFHPTIPRFGFGDPVSYEMMAQMTNTQRKLRDWFEDDFKRFRKVFRAMDSNHDGWCDRNELRTLPERTNLHYLLPHPVLEALIDLMDIDGDGRILYHEFVRVIMAEDLRNL